MHTGIFLKTYENNPRKFHPLDSSNSIVAETVVIFSYLMISQKLYTLLVEVTGFAQFVSLCHRF